MSGSVYLGALKNTKLKRVVQAEFRRCEKLLKKTNKIIEKHPNDTQAMQMSYEIRGAMAALHWVMSDLVHRPSKYIPVLHK